MEWDPLLLKGDIALKQHYLAEKGIEQRTITHTRVLAIVVGPFLIFCVNMALWILAFHALQFVVIAVQVGALCFSGFLVVASREANSARYLRHCALCVCVSTLVSFICGFFIYYKYAIYHFSYEDLRRYTNVEASQPPSAFQDSGMLEFAHTARVDVTRSVGYKSYTHGGRVFCVAPVMEQGMSSSAEIGFWAIGTDCCSARANFECGAANDPNAHSGVILLHDEIIAPQALSWVLNWFADRPWAEFDAALRLQNALYGTSMAKKHILLSWERYPIQVQNKFWRDGVQATISCCMLYLVFSIASGFGFSMYSRVEPKKK